MDSGQVVAVILAALAGGGISGIILAINARRKMPSEIRVNQADVEKKQAETTKIITEAAGLYTDMINEQLALMRCDMLALKTENDILRETQEKHEKEIAELQVIVEQFDRVLAGAHMLYEQVVELKETPKYKPPERRKA